MSGPAWSDKFDDVTYEEYDPHLADKGIVLDRKEKDEDEVRLIVRRAITWLECVQAAAGDAPMERPRTPPTDPSLDFDATRDAHLIGKNAKDVSEAVARHTLSIVHRSTRMIARSRSTGISASVSSQSSRRV